MKLSLTLLLALLISPITCAWARPAQQPVMFSMDTYTTSQQKARVGVAMTALPKHTTQVPGAGCLLCLAAAAGANSDLSAYSKTLSNENLPKLREDIVELLKRNGIDAVVIPDEIRLADLPKHKPKGENIAIKNFSSLGQKYGVDKLLLIDITALGFLRTYSAYFPTSDPNAFFAATGYIVDVNSNVYDWYLPVSITKSAEAEWKEPPSYPGLTNAYFQALEMGRDELLGPFVAPMPAATLSEADPMTAPVSVAGSEIIVEEAAVEEAAAGVPESQAKASPDPQP